MLRQSFCPRLDFIPEERMASPLAPEVPVRLLIRKISPVCGFSHSVTPSSFIKESVEV